MGQNITQGITGVKMNTDPRQDKSGGLDIFSVQIQKYEYNNTLLFQKPITGNID